MTDKPVYRPPTHLVLLGLVLWAFIALAIWKLLFGPLP